MGIMPARPGVIAMPPVVSTFSSVNFSRGMFIWAFCISAHCGRLSRLALVAPPWPPKLRSVVCVPACLQPQVVALVVLADEVAHLVV